MIRKTLTLVAIGLLTVGPIASTRADTGRCTLSHSIESTIFFAVQAWGPTPIDANNRAFELEQIGYRRASGVRFGFVPAAGGYAYYILMVI